MELPIELLTRVDDAKLAVRAALSAVGTQQFGIDTAINAIDLAPSFVCGLAPRHKLYTFNISEQMTCEDVVDPNSYDTGQDTAKVVKDPTSSCKDLLPQFLSKSDTHKDEMVTRAAIYIYKYMYRYIYIYI